MVRRCVTVMKVGVCGIYIWWEFYVERVVTLRNVRVGMEG